MDNCMWYAGAGATVLLIVFFVRRRKRSRPTWPRDKVILHQLTRGPWAPSISPFPIKLETYLRMADIPYQNDTDTPMSSKGKMPWITYNGEDVADTEFCIEYLNKKLDISMNKHLNSEQEAIATAFQRLVDEHLYWPVVLWRWKFEPGYKFITEAIRSLAGMVAPLLRWYVSRNVQKSAWGQGMGRHSEAEIFEIANTDLKALSDFIGNKPYLMGPEPCRQDCAVFGSLVQIIWQSPGSPINKMVKEQYPNLIGYCERMKERFWPDWEQCITHGYTVKATK